MRAGRNTPLRLAAALAAAGATVGTLGGCDRVTAPELPPQKAIKELRAETVEWVADGDTVHLGNGDKVRVLGINAPEVAHEKPAECGGEAARAALRTAVLGKRVTLVPDARSDDRDRYGRLLRYVEVKGVDVGLTLIEQGHAREYHPRSANAETRADKYDAAEARARRSGAGLWSRCER